MTADPWMAFPTRGGSLTDIRCTHPWSRVHKCSCPLTGTEVESSRLPGGTGDPRRASPAGVPRPGPPPEISGPRDRLLAGEPRELGGGAGRAWAALPARRPRLPRLRPSAGAPDLAGAPAPRPRRRQVMNQRETYGDPWRRAGDSVRQGGRPPTAAVAKGGSRIFFGGS